MRKVRLLFLILVLAFVLRILSFFQASKLQDSRYILPQIFNEPVQTTISSPEYVFKYYGDTYLIQPVAEYELYGLVVTHNNINSLADIYHDKRSVDIKDLCVLWGENVKTDDYQKIDFSSNSFVCNFSIADPRVYSRFNQYQISNNHILSQIEEVRAKIRSVAVGDQVYLSGHLVNYKKKGDDFVRKSSLSRNDMGDGACEVFMVDRIEILRRGNPFWNKIKEVSGDVVIVLMILLPIVFLYSVFAEQKKLYGKIHYR